MERSCNISADHLPDPQGMQELPGLEEEPQAPPEALAVPGTDDPPPSRHDPDQAPHRGRLIRVPGREWGE